MIIAARSRRRGKVRFSTTLSEQTEALLRRLARTPRAQAELLETLLLSESRRRLIGGSPAAAAPVDSAAPRQTAPEQSDVEAQSGEGRYCLLFRTMREGMALHEIIVDAVGKPVDYRFLDVNPAFEEQTGLRAADILGRTVRQVLPEIEDEWIRRYGEVALKGGQVRFEAFTGSLGRWYEVVAYCPVRGQFAAIFLDITDRRRAEEKLQESTAELRRQREEFRRLAVELDTILESIADALVVYDTDGRIVRLNAVAREMLGYDTEVEGLAIDRRGAEVVQPRKTDGSPYAYDEYPAVRALRGDIVRNQEMILHVPAGGGRDLWVSVASAPIRSDTGSIVGVVTTFMDTGEYHRVHDELQEANIRLLAQAEELRQAAELLERRVSQRTVELASANDALQASSLQLKALSRRLVETQESERRYIADQIYNQAGQLLAALKLRLAILEQRLAGNGEVSGDLSEMKEMLDQAMRRLHSLAVDLRPASLDRLGLVPALRQYVDEFGRDHGISTQLATFGLEGVAIPPDIETTLYRVVQSALANVAQHAQATSVALVLNRRGDRMVVAIEDNGVGFRVAEAIEKGKLGLLAMEERARGVGGELTIESRLGAGSSVVVEVPLMFP